MTIIVVMAKIKQNCRQSKKDSPSKLLIDGYVLAPRSLHSPFTTIHSRIHSKSNKFQPIQTRVQIWPMHSLATENAESRHIDPSATSSTVADIMRFK
jgi:hypothetical protein